MYRVTQKNGNFWKPNKTKTFLWWKHAFDRSTDLWLLNGEVVCSSRSLFRNAANCTWLPLRISKVPVFCVTLYKRNIAARLCNHCYSGKIISIAYSRSVFVALVTQHAKSMRRIVLSSVACLAVPYVSILSHKQNDFRGEKLLNLEYIFCVY